MHRASKSEQPRLECIWNLGGREWKQDLQRIKSCPASLTQRIQTRFSTWKGSIWQCIVSRRKTEVNSLTIMFSLFFSEYIWVTEWQTGTERTIIWNKAGSYNGSMLWIALNCHVINNTYQYIRSFWIKRFALVRMDVTACPARLWGSWSSQPGCNFHRSCSQESIDRDRFPDRLPHTSAVDSFPSLLPHLVEKTSGSPSLASPRNYAGRLGLQ